MTNYTILRDLKVNWELPKVILSWTIIISVKEKFKNKQDFLHYRIKSTDTYFQPFFDGFD